jgi:hypothetical protein
VSKLLIGLEETALTLYFEYLHFPTMLAEDSDFLQEMMSAALQRNKAM